jgi:CRP-like cAMP-binding protein
VSRFLSLLATRSDAEAFQPGEPIYLEGAGGSLLFVLLAGEVELERGGETIGVVAAGEIFGESALLGESRRTSTARARTAVTVAPVGPALYQFLVERAPEIASAVRDAERRHQNPTIERSHG